MVMYIEVIRTLNALLISCYNIYSVFVKVKEFLSCEAIDLTAADGSKVDEDDYIYGRNKEGILCRFSTEGVVENELCTFGFQETRELDYFEDMRRRLTDPEVCVWISYDKYMNLNQTV